MTIQTTEALLALLRADTTLFGICPDGVWVDEAPPSAQRFVIVSLIVGFDEQMFGGRAYEDVLYLVKAVILSTTGGNIAVAAARINEILHYKNLVVPNAVSSLMRRTERVRETEVDPDNPAIRWFHRGGRYQIVTSPL